MQRTCILFTVLRANKFKHKKESLHKKLESQLPTINSLLQSPSLHILQVPRAGNAKKLRVHQPTWVLKSLKPKRTVREGAYFY